MSNLGDTLQNTSLGSVQLIYALNKIATALQQSIQSEENAYSIFQSQVIALGLRGGISEYDEARQVLCFKTVAFTNPLRKLLNRFENELDTHAEGYIVDVSRVDVYSTVVHDSRAVFVADTSSVSSQVVPNRIRGVVGPLLTFLGRPPGIFAPLVYDGKVMGMLNIVGPDLTEADIPTMQAFANQIAVALENARLVKKLRTANEALELAYQKTLEGWVQALDLRDNETEGHTLRVADVTVQLALHMGLPEEDMQSIRHGALLHDIGKMAVPDNILLKPGLLNDAEWKVMKQHPTTAYNWLKTIEYLQPAVMVPYCHHERWDGSGYEQGLSGEDIPLAARIFSVIDVWDAMRSDRPYRKALSQEQTLDFIRSKSGVMFDTRVVDAFFGFLAKYPDLDRRQHDAGAPRHH